MRFEAKREEGRDPQYGFEWVVVDTTTGETLLGWFHKDGIQSQLDFLNDPFAVKAAEWAAAPR